jgi:hypothetical protein
MHVGIFDTEHFETVYPLLKLFQQAGNRITVFTNAPMAKLLSGMLGSQTNEVNFIIQAANEGHAQFAFRMHKTMRSQPLDMLWYSTINHNFLFHALLLYSHKRMRPVLTVHAINSLFSFPFSVDPVQLIKQFGKKIFLKRIQAFNVLDGGLSPLLLQKTGGKRPVYRVPGVIYEGINLPLALTDKIILVVPGAIDRGRRNYHEIFALLSIAEAAKLPLTIVLLGAAFEAYGADILRQAGAYKGVYTAVQYFDADFIEPPVFDTWLKAAHFIFLPAVITSFAYAGVAETYGLSKISGGFFDAIRVAKPFIHPADLQVPAGLENSGFKYQRLPQVVDFLQTVLSNKNIYHSYAGQAVQNSLPYTVERLSTEHKTALTASGRYYIKQYPNKGYLHGGIGYTDMEMVLDNEGYQSIIFYEGTEWFATAKRWLQMRKTTKALAPASTIVCLLPVYARMNRYFIEQLAGKGHRFIFVLADIDGLKDQSANTLSAELRLILLSKYFIVHSNAMAAWLKTQVPQATTAIIGPFDFLTTVIAKQRTKSNIVCFAGNLAKSKFLENLSILSAVHFNLYGEGISEKTLKQNNCSYKGSFLPQQLPQQLDASFGLVWEGDAIDRAAGALGLYSKLIFHHKLSLYIIAQLPVIVASFSASAAYVKLTGIGWLIDSLEEIPQLISGITEQAYQNAVNNMRPIAAEISRGEHLKKALLEITDQPLSS